MAGAENLRGNGSAMNGWFVGSIEPWSQIFGRRSTVVLFRNVSLRCLLNISMFLASKLWFQITDFFQALHMF